MTVLLIKILVGFIALIWTADRLVHGASALAVRLGISTLVIGLTIVAFGTSAPEIFVSISAGLEQHADIALGNAIGSNIANIGLVLGTCATLRAIPFHQGTLKAELPLLIFITFLMSFGMWYLGLTPIFGGGCLLVITLYIFWLVRRTHRQTRENRALEKEYAHEIPNKMPPVWIAIWLSVGLVGLPLSADLLVINASELARLLGVSDAIIGLTLIALGTSLPELATSVMGILRKEENIAFGNIIGSNIFNLTAVLAPIGFLQNKEITDHMVFLRDIPVMIVFTLLMCGRIWFNGAQTVLTRRFGLVFLGGYIVYIVAILSHSAL